ncbi:MAG TPA: PH domain-containing protein [Candidatus Saccharimonadales bacterium]|nr:PH domain-containing protein [Candidatus Saccharimonadales bacterium]
MVTKESVEEQLKKIGVNYHGWGRTEMSELPDVILPDEEIFECVNGFYEGGFALLVATNFRVLLIDRKPMRYLTVEDLRFDMISEIDFSRRLLAAQINVSTGSKNLRFISINHLRLRKLIGHVQHCMAENKKKQSEHEEDQKLHLEQINQQLQAYLLAQHQQQQKIQEHLERDSQKTLDVEPLRPSPELSDYLYAQGLLAQAQQQNGLPPAAATSVSSANSAELYNEGLQEVFGRRPQTAQTQAPVQQSRVDQAQPQLQPQPQSALHHALEINPLRIAYSKLPLAMRNKKFGRPSFHAHSQEPQILPATPVTETR